MPCGLSCIRLAWAHGSRTLSNGAPIRRLCLRQQLDARSDPVIQALLTEILAYPAPAGGVALASSDGPQRYATPLTVATRLGTVSFLNTTTVFGTPTDVTLSELALEMLFPADDQTRAVIRLMLDEDAAVERGHQSRRCGRMTINIVATFEEFDAKL